MGTDHKYLGLLIRHGEMTAGDLSKLTGLTTGAITGLGNRLEKRKLVKRAFGKDDRRKILVVPDTAYDMRRLGGPFSTLQKKMVRLISTLTEKETDIIRKYLISTIEVMKEVTNSLNVKEDSNE